MSHDTDTTEHRTASHNVYEGRTLRLSVDSVRLPDGRDGMREVVRHNGSVAVVAVEGDRVYFVRQYRYAAGKPLLELPAGTLEPGEDPETAARREIEEEIGMAAERLTFLFEGYVSPGYTDELQRFYLAEGLSPKSAPADEDEFIAVETMTWVEALAAVDGGAFQDSKTVAGLLAAARRLGVSG